jgi:hypothetical protein
VIRVRDGGGDSLGNLARRARRLQPAPRLIRTPRRRSRRDNRAVQRFSSELRSRFPQRVHIFDDYEQEIGEWEAAFRDYAEVVVGEEGLLRATRRLTARRLVAHQSTNVASRGVNLGNAVVLLLNRRHAHAAPAVARALFETCAMAVYADRRLVPLFEKRRSPKRTAEAHRLLFRLGLGTHPSSETTHVKAISVESFVRAMGAEADEVMRRDEDTPPPWVDERTYGEAIRHTYSVLSELTHPNSLAITLSHVGDDEWNLQPEVDDPLLTATLRPSWVALKAGRAAMRDLMHAADEHPMEFTDPDPGFSADELNPTTRLWE